MIKIMLYGVMSEYNFGGPSLMHGVREIVKQLHDDYSIVCYQRTNLVDIAVSDMDFPVLKVPYQRAHALILDAIKAKLGLRIKDPDCALFWQHLKEADIIANLLGICFCSNFKTGTFSYLKALRLVAGPFLPCIVAKYLFGKKTVKCTSSYGPIVSRNDLVSARLSARYVFDVMSARECESRRQMSDVAKIARDIKVSPDMANMMPCQQTQSIDKNRIGLSVSHQIIKQWKSSESYVSCIANLITQVQSKMDCSVILIPNETHPSSPYNDIHVAEDIMRQLAHTENIVLLDINRLSSSQLKNEIAKCEVLVASRYHACVAALSAGVPTLVIGWHHKYDELLSLYGQQQWIISCKDCTAEGLVERFHQFWKERHKSKQKIEECRPAVQKQVIEAGKSMFMK